MKIKTGELFYYLFFCSLLFAKGIGLYDGQPAFKVCLILALLCFALKMGVTSHSVKEWVLIALLLLLGGVTYLISGEKGALLYVMMVVGLKGVPLKRVFLVGAITWSISFGGLFLLTSTHLIDSPFKVHNRLGLGMIIRWSLGYAHPNVLHVSYLVFVMFLVYLLDRKLRFGWFFLLFAGNLYVFLYSVSSTGLLAVTFYLILSLYWSLKGRLSKPETFLIQLAMPIFVLFSILGPLWIKGRAFDVLNRIMNTRMNLSRYFLTNTDPTLFGVRIADLMTDQYTMDNSYVFAFVTYGVVLFVVTAAGYFLLIRQCCRQQKGKELCIILACLLAGLTEPFLFNTSFKNLSLLFMGLILFQAKEGQGNLALFKKWDREWSLDYGLEKKLLPLKKPVHGRIIILLAAGAALLIGAGGYFLLGNMPERIIVPRKICDETDIEPLYIREGDLPNMEGDLILGYVDEDTPMIPLKGNLILMEKVRNSFTCGVLCGLGVIILSYILKGIISIRTRKKEKKSC